MAPYRTADQAEREAEAERRKQQEDVTYYGSTTTAATPQTPAAPQQPTYSGGTPTSPTGYLPPPPPPPVYYDGTPTAPYRAINPTAYASGIVYEIRDLQPSEDYSAAGAYQRAIDAVEWDTRQDYYTRYGYGDTNQPIDPREYSIILRMRKANAVRYMIDNVPKTLEQFPELRRALTEAELDPEDYRRLVNLAELESAYQAYSNATTDQARMNIVLTMNPVQRMALFDFSQAKVQEKLEYAQTWQARVGERWDEFFDRNIRYPLDRLLWLNEKSQQSYRAFTMSKDKMMEAIKAGPGHPEFGTAVREAVTGISPAAAVPGIIDQWSSVEPYTYDQAGLDRLRAEYGTLRVDAVLRWEELKNDGKPDAWGRWANEFVGTPAQDVVRQLTEIKDADPKLLELAEKLNSYNNGNTGMLTLGVMNLPDEWRGTDAYADTASAINVAGIVLLDPIILGAAGFSAFRSARLGLTKLSNAPGIEAAFKMGTVRRTFDELGRTITAMEKMSPEQRAIARDVVRRQYGDMLPPAVIDEMVGYWKTFPDGSRQFIGFSKTLDDGTVVYGVRNADDAQSWFTSKLIAESILSGAGMGDKFGGYFEQMWKLTNVARRKPLMPHMTPLRAMAARARMWTAIHNPTNRRFARRLADEIGDLDDPLAVAQWLETQGVAFGMKTGVQPVLSGLLKDSTEFGYRYADKSFSARLDRLMRRFAKAPFTDTIYLADGRDAGKIYKWARVFLTRHDAAFMADVWRNAGSEAIRKQIFNGLVKTHASAMGVQFRSGTPDFWRKFMPEVSRGGQYSPTLMTKRAEDGTFVAFAADDVSIPGSSLLPSIEDIQRFRPSKYGNDDLPIHLWQTSDWVQMPNFAAIEQAGVRASIMGAVMGATHGKIAQGIVDAWSLGNLIGPRYFMRNAIEDYAFYAMTSGRFGALYKGRRFSTVLRDVRGRPLGVVNKRLRPTLRKLDDYADSAISPPGLLAQWRFLSENMDAAEKAAAMRAAKEGNIEPMRQLVATAMARSKLTGWNAANQEDLLDFVTEHGVKLIDEAAEVSGYGASGMFPYLSMDGTAVIDLSEGVRNARIVYPTREWGDVAPNLNSRDSFIQWQARIIGAADRDGTIGKLVIANLDMPTEDLVRLVAQAIRDDKVWGYKTRLAAFTVKNVSEEEFAFRYILDVRNLFAKPNGQLNRELWDKVAPWDPVRGRRNVRGWKDGGPTVSLKDLQGIPASDLPESILGTSAKGAPVAQSVSAFDKAWMWMGEQYARFSREPIFLANYLEQRQLLRPVERQMATLYGPAAARQKASEMATDRAYQLLLSYTDNPLNRTLLAWNARNVARYYRATEDFIRRSLRVTKNYPQGLWKLALAYDTVQDTGFIYDDENGEKYFIFPGSEEVLSFMNRIMSIRTYGFDAVRGMVTDYTGVNVGGQNRTLLKEMDPVSYGMRGYLKFVTPSGDMPNSFLATFSSPIAAMPIATAFELFPQFQELETLLLGKYSEGASFWEQALPGHLVRLFGALDRDERYSAYAAAFKDAVQVSMAAGAAPEFDPDDPQKYAQEWVQYGQDLDNLVTAMLFTRFATSFYLPTPGRITANDVTDYIREGGPMGMDPAWREMIRVAAEEGSMNPFAEASIKYVETFGLQAIPYTMSTREGGNRFSDPTGQLATVAATKKGEEWLKENKDLLEGEYRDTAVGWLLPRDGEYSPTLARKLTAMGAMSPSSYTDFYAKSQNVIGRWVLYSEMDYIDTIVAGTQQRYYDAVQSGDGEAADAIWKELGDIEERRALAKAKIMYEYGTLPRDEISLTQGARTAFLDQNIRPMLNYIVNERDKEPDDTMKNIVQAVATFDAYVTRLSLIEGSTDAEDQAKRMNRLEGLQMLEDIASRDMTTRQFVERILIPLFTSDQYGVPYSAAAQVFGSSSG